MKQNSFLKSSSSRWVSLLTIVSLFTTTSCGMFKSGKGQTTSKGGVPSSYNKPPASQSNQQARLSYIDKFKGIAISEMNRTGVPASIKLAQGLLESDAGRSLLAASYNNHFGIKCHSNWQGERYYQEDDDKDPLTGQLIKSCFRAYKSPEESFMAHSEFLRDPNKVNRYGFLFQLPRTDYISWAQGLQRAGYATSSDYGDKLIGMVQDYQLAQYDNASFNQNTANGGNPPANNNIPPNNGGNANANTGGNYPPQNNNPVDNFPVNGFPANNNTNPNNQNQGGWMANNNTPVDMEGERNDVKYVRAAGSMTGYELAGKYGVSINDLKTYNEELPDPSRPLPNGMVVYTQKKRNGWNGSEKAYRVRDCETMYDISQKFGIKLSKLYSKNEMREGEQPAVGQNVLLRRGWFQSAVKPALRDTIGEWRRCKMPDTSSMKRPSNVVNNNTQQPNGVNGGGMGFEISPNGSQGQAYPNNSSGTTTYPSSSYPSNNSSGTTTYPSSSYPSNNSSGTTTYPSSSYPSNNSSGTTTYPSSSYPSNNSSGTTTYPSDYPSTTPTYPADSYPSSSARPPTAYPSSRPSTGKATQKPTSPKPAPSSPSTNSGGQYHTVAQGETLWAISRKYNLTVDRLKQLNGLPDNTIKPGQQLRIK